MLQLVANSTESTTTLPIRWCASKELVGELRGERVVHPHLLLVTTQKNREVERRLMPLDQLLEYVQFHRPGKHRLQATVVYHKDGDVRKLKAVLLGGWAHGEKFGKSYLVDYEGKLFAGHTDHNELGVFTVDDPAELEVEVDNGHFAKEPKPWEKWWVNLWFPTPPHDQCAFRKRRIVAYTPFLQPLVVFLYLALLMTIRIICASWFLSLAKRGVNFKPIYHPWNYDTNDIWWEAKRGNIFTRTKEGKDRLNEDDPRCFFVPMTPIVGIIAFIGLCLRQHFVRHKQVNITLMIMKAVGLQVAASAGLCALFGAILAIFWLVDTFNKKVRPRLPNANRFSKGALVFAKGLAKTVIAMVIMAAFVLGMIFIPDFVFFSAKMLVIITAIWFAAVWFGNYMSRRAETEVEMARKDPDAYYAGYQPLLCDGKPMRAEVAALPKEHRTVRLHFQELKAKVCRPFAA